MLSCLICYNLIDNPTTLPSCPCVFCADCLYSWLSLRIHDFSYKNCEKLSCPNEFCHAKYMIDPEFLSKSPLSKLQQDSLDNMVFFKYLQNTTDVRECPNSGCNYFGFLNNEDTCKEKYQCEMCNSCWEQENFIPDKILEKINRFLTGKIVGEMLSYVYQELFTESCPNCLINISRNGGCYHMTCKNCGFQFCWYCKQKYAGHRLNICVLHMIVKFFINFVVVVWVLGKLGLTVSIWEGLVVLLFFINKFLIFYNIVLVIFLIYAIYVYQYIRLRNDVARRKTELGLIFFGSIALTALIFLIRKGYILESLCFWVIEIIISGIIYNIVSVSIIIYNNWISNVE